MTNLFQDTVAECTTYCNAESTCVGFDFDSAGDRCWWHTAASLANVNAQATATTTQYVKGEEVCATPTGPGTTRAREFSSNCSLITAKGNGSYTRNYEKYC